MYKWKTVMDSTPREHSIKTNNQSENYERREFDNFRCPPLKINLISIDKIK